MYGPCWVWVSAAGRGSRYSSAHVPAVQKNHLCGSTINESAAPSPSNRCLRSGSIRAPAP